MGRPAKNGVAGHSRASKATEAQYRRMLEMRREGATQMEIAAEVGLPQRTISGMLARRTEPVPEVDVVSLDNLDDELAQLTLKKSMLLAGITPEKVARMNGQQCAMGYAILRDKESLLRGQATAIVDHRNRGKVEDLAKRLLEVMERRGMVRGGVLPVVEGEFKEVVG